MFGLGHVNCLLTRRQVGRLGSCDETVRRSRRSRELGSTGKQGSSRRLATGDNRVAQEG
jgi:hypothetical protein